MRFDELTELEQLFNCAKVVPSLLVEFLHLDKLARLVDCTFPALSLPILDLAVNQFPLFRGAVLPEAPFFELTLVLAFAVTVSGAYLGVHSPEFKLLTFQ
jgi:hypothetical protein